MTYFEFVSVAMSLIFALAVADILRAMIPAVGKARYLPHFCFLINSLLLIAYTWMGQWANRHISWDGLTFVYSLINPALLTIGARLLTTRNPESVESFREHFLQSKQAFFLVIMVFTMNSFVYTWILGIREVGAISGAPQVGSLIGFVIAIWGLVVRSDRAIGGVALVSMMLLIALIAFAPGDLGTNV